jgi:hypothetical protein
MRVFLMCLLAVCGCARGGSITGEGEDGGITAPRHDAAAADARPAPRSDAAPPPPPPPDAPPPPPPPDACIPMTTQLLANASLDQSPQGAGWVEHVIKAGFPLITPEDNKTGPIEHTAPYKAWLGGFTGNGVTDVLYQDVAIPAATQQLALTGFHDVRTDEPAGSAAYDTAAIELTQPSGAVIATALGVSNATPQTAWTFFNHTFTQNLSGQTVRLRITSTNDGGYPTSFYFDTLALTATHGCP